MTSVLTSRRWQIAVLGLHVVGALGFVGCVWSADWSWWLYVAWSCAYLTGFLAAVLVKIGTQ